MKQFKLGLSLIVFAFLTACGGGGGGGVPTTAPQVVVVPPPILDTTFKSVCGHQDPMQVTMLNSVNVSTNDWGVFGKILPYTFNECVNTRNVTEDTVMATFEWHLPPCVWFEPVSATNVHGDIKAFPEIIYGHQLGGATSKNSKLPASIATVMNMAVKYDVSVTSDGLDQTFFDVVYTSSPNGNTATTDITVFIKPTPIQPVGTFVENVTIDGVNYDVYIAPGNTAPRYSIGFFVKEDHLVGTFKMKPITDYLVGKNFLSASNFLESIELGTEIISGNGKTTVNSFQVVQL